MASPITNDTEFAAAIKQILSDARHGDADKDKAVKAFDYWKAAPAQTINALVMPHT